MKQIYDGESEGDDPSAHAKLLADWTGDLARLASLVSLG